MISPGYGYAAVDDKEMFMTRDDIRAKFRAAEAMFRKYKFNTSPIYLEFLQGKREMACTAWGNPTRNIKGWKGPVLPDHRHPPRDLRRPLEQDPLGKYGHGNDPRCERLHGPLGLRGHAAIGVNKQLGDTLKMIRWQFT